MLEVINLRDNGDITPDEATRRLGELLAKQTSRTYEYSAR